PCPETAAAPAPERTRPRGPRPGAARAPTSRRQGEGRGGRNRQTSAKRWWRASGEEADEQRRGGVRRGADLERVAHPGEQSDTDHRVEGVAGGWSGTLLVKDRQDTLLEGEGHLASEIDEGPATHVSVVGEPAGEALRPRRELERVDGVERVDGGGGHLVRHGGGQAVGRQSAGVRLGLREGKAGIRFRIRLARQRILRGHPAGAAVTEVR